MWQYVCVLYYRYHLFFINHRMQKLIQWKGAWETWRRSCWCWSPMDSWAARSVRRRWSRWRSTAATPSLWRTRCERGFNCWMIHKIMRRTQKIISIPPFCFLFWFCFCYLSFSLSPMFFFRWSRWSRTSLGKTLSCLVCRQSWRRLRISSQTANSTLKSSRSPSLPRSSELPFYRQR